MVTIIEPSTFTELIFPDLTGPPEFMEILDTRARFEVNLNWYGGVWDGGLGFGEMETTHRVFWGIIRFSDEVFGIQ